MSHRIPEFIEIDLRPISDYFTRVKRSLELELLKDPEPESRVCLRFSRNYARYHHFVLEGYSCYEGEGLIKLKFKKVEPKEKPKTKLKL